MMEHAKGLQEVWQPLKPGGGIDVAFNISYQAAHGRRSDSSALRLLAGYAPANQSAVDWNEKTGGLLRQHTGWLQWVWQSEGFESEKHGARLN